MTAVPMADHPHHGVPAEDRLVQEVLPAEVAAAGGPAVQRQEAEVMQDAAAENPVLLQGKMKTFPPTKNRATALFFLFINF